MAPDKIEDSVVVTLHYVLSLDDGSQVEETEADDPLVYLHGHSNIIPGLENELTGLKVGDKKTVVVDPEDAYGFSDPDNIETVDRHELPDRIKPEPGMLLSFQDEDGHGYMAEVIEVDDDTVTLDFNHPMADERLHFDVTIAELRAASPEELAHGHVHAGHDHHH